MRFTNTCKALKAYDEAKANGDALLSSGASFKALWDHINLEDLLAREVGIAFGRDTAGFNSTSTCEGCVRPSPWLRRLVG